MRRIWGQLEGDFLFVVFSLGGEAEVVLDITITEALLRNCLLYTSDAADDSLRVDLGGRRIIKKKK